jgi:hypothetical protein
MPFFPLSMGGWSLVGSWGKERKKRQQERYDAIETKRTITFVYPLIYESTLMTIPMQIQGCVRVNVKNVSESIS